MRAYEYRHIVSFEESSLVGNVYFLHPLRWQGRCREMFLRDHVPGVLTDLERGFCLVTTKCSCDYVQEVHVFDEVVVRMRLGSAAPDRLHLHFECVRRGGGSEQIVAMGEQEIVSMSRQGARLVPTPLPGALVAALEQYGSAAPDPPARSGGVRYLAPHA